MSQQTNQPNFVLISIIREANKKHSSPSCSRHQLLREVIFLMS